MYTNTDMQNSRMFIYRLVVRECLDHHWMYKQINKDPG